MWKMQIKEYMRECELWDVQKGIDNQTKLKLANTKLPTLRNAGTVWAAQKEW